MSDKYRIVGKSTVETDGTIQHYLKVTQRTSAWWALPGTFDIAVTESLFNEVRVQGFVTLSVASV